MENPIIVSKYPVAKFFKVRICSPNLSFENRFFHYILPCKELLFKWHITTNNLCNNCQITENYEHFSLNAKDWNDFGG
jgi:hypothetical protein